MHCLSLEFYDLLGSVFLWSDIPETSNAEELEQAFALEISACEDSSTAPSTVSSAVDRRLD